MQRLDSREEEVGPAPHPDKRRWALDVEVRRAALYRDVASLINIMADRIRSRVEAVEVGVVDPGMLDHLELSRDVSVKCNEQHSLLSPLVIGSRLVGRRRLIGSAAPYDAMHL